MTFSRIGFGSAVACLLATVLNAHDTWVQTNTHLVRTGDAIHIDLMLGNHGNDHRDFKLASKLSTDSIQTFAVRTPDGKTYDLKPELSDLGYAPKEGFHSVKFTTAAPGIYLAYQSSDGIVNHGKPLRSVRTAKAYFQASDSLDKVAKLSTGFEKPIGNFLELVSTANPVVPMGPGTPIAVQLIFEGKPLVGTKVSFIPRGTVLKEGMDADYERLTDSEGKASFTPKTGNYYLVVAHHATEEKSEKFESTKYSATLVVFVPEKCPCCE